MAVYSYGAYQINANSSGLGLFLMAKDLDMPTYRPTLSPIGRLDAVKINGYQISERQLQVDILIVGSSRTDCIARKDTLEAALALRDMPLTLHEDGRYFAGANAIVGKAKFAAGKGIVQCLLPVTFLCPLPFAVATASSTFDTGNQVLSFLTGSTYISSIISFAGGGSAYSYPQIHLINKTANAGSTTLTTGLTAGNTYTSLAVASAPALADEQIITLYYLTGGPLFQLWSQKVVVNGAVTAGAVSITVDSFVAAYSFPVTVTSVLISTAWNSVSVAQLSDNQTIAATGTVALPLPQTLNDTLDIYCDPTGPNGWQILTNGLPTSSDPVGTFPVVEPATTQWTVSIASDAQPTVEVIWTWAPRWQS